LRQGEFLFHLRPPHTLFRGLENVAWRSGRSAPQKNS
jgi:hypothetical protein